MIILMKMKQPFISLELFDDDDESRRRFSCHCHRFVDIANTVPYICVYIRGLCAFHTDLPDFLSQRRKKKLQNLLQTILQSDGHKVQCTQTSLTSICLTRRSQLSYTDGCAVRLALMLSCCT